MIIHRPQNVNQEAVHTRGLLVVFVGGSRKPNASASPPLCVVGGAACSLLLSAALFFAAGGTGKGYQRKRALCHWFEREIPGFVFGLRAPRASKAYRQSFHRSNFPLHTTLYTTKGFLVHTAGALRKPTA